MRNVTEVTVMPRGRKPEGEQALSNAERQARCRARRQAPLLLPAVPPRRSADRRSRPRRWRDAVREPLVLPATPADWLAARPDNLRASFTELAGVEPPRGYGRDYNVNEKNAASQLFARSPRGSDPIGARLLDRDRGAMR